MQRKTSSLIVVEMGEGVGMEVQGLVWMYHALRGTLVVPGRGDSTVDGAVVWRRSPDPNIARQEQRAGARVLYRTVPSGGSRMCGYLGGWGSLMNRQDGRATDNRLIDFLLKFGRAMQGFCSP